MTDNSISTIVLIRNGFSVAGVWRRAPNGKLHFDGTLPTLPGVYIFCVNGIANYCGVASQDLRKRLTFYECPGVSQRTNIRLHAKIASTIDDGRIVEVLIATPPDLEWYGWPIAGAPGLEAGLIQKYSFPWNILGSNKSVRATQSRSMTPQSTIEKAVTQYGGKYGALRSHLEQNGKDTVSMTFGEIESLVGKLPKSAYLHQAWWGNHEGNSQAKSWMGARYLVEANPSRRSVVFRKFSY